MSPNKQDRPFQLGSISHGTLRDEDLLSAFLDALKDLDIEAYAKVVREYADVIAWFDADENERAERKLPEPDEQIVSGLVSEELFDYLTDCAPPFAYFGAHPGDGSDFGFWPEDMYTFNQTDSIPFDQDKDLSVVSDLADFPEFVRVVNDHGNVTQYRVELKELWSCV